MKFGIFLPPYHALNENPAAALDRDIALLKLPRRLTVWQEPSLIKN